MFGPIFISAVTFWGLALAGGFYWGRRYVRAIESQGAARDQIAALEARIRVLEGASPDDHQLGERSTARPQLRDRSGPS